MAEDLSYVVTLRRKFGYLESIPGVLLPHPSSAGVFPDASSAAQPWPGMMPMPPDMYVDPYGAPVVPGPAPMHIMPSMSSLEALLSKLPSVVPPQPPHTGSMPGVAAPAAPATTKEEELEEDYVHCGMDTSAMPSNGAGESTSTSGAAAAATAAPMSSYFVDVGGKPGESGF